MFVAIAMAGCEPTPPAGQVIARVDGEDVTRRDLLLEIEATGIVQGADVKQLQTELVNRIVARKLLAGAARKNGIDTTPDYLAAIRRDREERMIQFLERRDSAALSAPSGAVIARQVAERAAAFRARQIMTIDRLRFAHTGPADIAFTQGQIDAVAQRLDLGARRYVRERVQVDSLTLPHNQIAALQATLKGRPVVHEAVGEFVLERLIASIPVPVATSGYAALAKAELLQLALERTAKQRVARMRARTLIEYQPGYAP